MGSLTDGVRAVENELTVAVGVGHVEERLHLGVAHLLQALLHHPLLELLPVLRGLGVVAAERLQQLLLRLRQRLAARLLLPQPLQLRIGLEQLKA